MFDVRSSESFWVIFDFEFEKVANTILVFVCALRRTTLVKVDCTTCPTYTARQEFFAIFQEPASISPEAQANLEAEQAVEKAEVEEMIFEEAPAPSGEVIETDDVEQAGLETLAPLESVEETDADVDQLRLARM